MFASRRTWLDTLGWLAEACSLRPGNTQQRRIWLDSCQKRCGDQLCWSGQIGRVERRGAMLKKMMSKVIKDTNASGRETLDMILSDGLNAANKITRHRVLLLRLWVLPRLHRIPGTPCDEDTGRQLLVYSHVTERRHVKRS